MFKEIGILNCVFRQISSLQDVSKQLELNLILAPKQSSSYVFNVKNMDGVIASIASASPSGKSL